MSEYAKEMFAELYIIVKSRAFNETNTKLCGEVVRRWLDKYNISPIDQQKVLIQFAARLNQEVVKQKIPPESAAEILAKIIVLSDLSIPHQVVATATALNKLYDHLTNAPDMPQQQFAGYIHQEMIKAMEVPSYSPMQEYRAEACRYLSKFRKRRDARLTQDPV
ncbi:MAG: hypothetical protein CMF25_08065 [Kangiellaceae bacterium]|jgi:hypothetical protein|nr:hypothetical protein [Kangiellaceae bacterium]|tara:strand:+ start:65 stop:556 length:492 start_codon:yes stop_codon:yes gene_type:complete